MHTDNEYQQMIATASRKWRDAQYSLDTELFVAGKIDEVSLLFSNRLQLAAFVGWAHRNGLEHFNTVDRDRMNLVDYSEAFNETTVHPGIACDGGDEPDHGSWFDVRFEFLRLPGAPWRIEAMCVLSGCAPLHSQHLAAKGEGCVIHASWKEVAITDYSRTTDALRQDGGSLFDSVPFLAEYQNSYGRFSYWGSGTDLYFKPRVNLRDPQPAR